MNEAPIIGIDLGTTHSLVGVIDSGFPIVLADEKGERLLPSCVSWPAGREPLVGSEAMRGRLLAPGKQDIPVWLTIGVGILAALIGSAIVGGMRDTNGLDWVELLVQLVLAVVGVVAAAAIYPRSRSHA